MEWQAIFFGAGLIYQGISSVPKPDPTLTIGAFASELDTGKVFVAILDAGTGLVAWREVAFL